MTSWGCWTHRDVAGQIRDQGAVRDVAVYLLGHVKAASKAAATRRLAAHPEEALALLPT
jgi:hypothetical protein